MSDNLACAHARESAALEWLSGYDPGDGHSTVAAQALDPSSLFTQPVVLAAFAAGVDQADADYAIERSIGQRQLDDAWALMAESVALFRGYATHHQRRAELAVQAGDLESARASFQKAMVNLTQALRLREWMAGEDHYTVSRDVPGEDTVVAHASWAGNGSGAFIGVDFGAGCMVEPFPIPAEIAPNGDLVPVDTKARSNIRPVTDGPMSDPVMIDALLGALGGPAHSLSMVKASALRLQTGDPRFDPAKPVVVNGFLYHPATEA